VFANLATNRRPIPPNRAMLETSKRK
jgi:hypothetical protein